MKELFDKKYVHFMWEDELEGKEGFFADNCTDPNDLPEAHWKNWVIAIYDGGRLWCRAS